MDIALWELYRTGFLHVLVYPGHFLCYIGWAAVLIGALIQWLLLKKTRETETKWFFAGILFFGLFIGETGYQSITGWDRLVPLLGYWLCLLLLSGVGLSCLFYLILKKYWK